MSTCVHTQTNTGTRVTADGRVVCLRCGDRVDDTKDES